MGVGVAVAAGSLRRGGVEVGDRSGGAMSLGGSVGMVKELLNMQNER